MAANERSEYGSSIKIAVLGSHELIWPHMLALHAGTWRYLTCNAQPVVLHAHACTIVTGQPRGRTGGCLADVDIAITIGIHALFPLPQESLQLRKLHEVTHIDLSRMLSQFQLTPGASEDHDHLEL